MQTSGLFTVHQHTVKHCYGKPLNLIIFGDVHRDSPNHADGHWRDFLARARTVKDALYLGMGDYLDATSTSERECLGHISSKMHETFNADLNQLKEAKIDLIAKELEFMRGRLIGLVNGNHYYEFQSGINSDQKLCEKLGAKYLGVCAFIRLTIACSDRRHTLDLFVHHGKGASRLVGGSLNRVAQMIEGTQADVFIMGHDHKKGAVPSSRIFLQHAGQKGLEVRHRDVWNVRSGSFLASYRDGEVNYNVDACRGASSLGHVELHLTLSKHGEIKIQSLV